MDILTTLGARRYPIAARDLAQRFDVSERTIYRDIEMLRANGAEIGGEAGFGYVLESAAHIPPLNFTEDEIYAILTGLEMVSAFTDDEFAQSSDKARDKIITALDYRRRAIAECLPYRAPRIFANSDTRARHQKLREAINAKQKIDISYVSIHNMPSQRVIWPLGLAAWGDKWTLTAWCETQEEYRNFRTDLIKAFHVLDQTFETHDRLSFAHFLDNVSRPKEVP